MSENFAICSDGEQQADEVPEFVLRQAPERPELDRYAEAQWEVTFPSHKHSIWFHCLGGEHRVIAAQTPLMDADLMRV